MAPNHGGDTIGPILGPMGSHWVQKMGQNRKKLPCPKIRIFHYPTVIGFSHKLEVTVMAPNHGGDTIESILGPVGSHWVKKMGQNRKKFPYPKMRIFDYPMVIDFSQKMELTVMARSHGGDTIGSILGPMGSHWVQKMSQNRRKLPCPQIRIFHYPAVIGFSQKMEVTVLAPNHVGDPLGYILGPMGSHWVQKMGQNRKKLPCPKIRIFNYPAVIDFSQKMEVAVMAPNHGGDTIESILGPMGSHWVQKMGQNRKKLPCPKIRIFHFSSFFPKNGSYGYGAKSRWISPRVHLGACGVPLGKKKWVKTVENYHAPKFEFSFTPRTSIFSKKWKLRLWRQITVGTRQSPSWGQWGPIGSKKWVKTVKNYHAPKFEFSLTPRTSIFSKKWKLRLWRQIYGGDPLGSILGPVGSNWVQKNVSNRKKITMPQNSNFRLPHGHRFFAKKMELTVMAPNHRGDPLGSIFGSNGVPLG